MAAEGLGGLRPFVLLAFFQVYVPGRCTHVIDGAYGNKHEIGTLHAILAGLSKGKPIRAGEFGEGGKGVMHGLDPLGLCLADKSQ